MDEAVLLEPGAHLVRNILLQVDADVVAFSLAYLVIVLSVTSVHLRCFQSLVQRILTVA
jgi:hypothetical protein